MVGLEPTYKPFINILYLKGQTLCGSEGIRTPGQVSPTPAFKTGAFNRSATLPNYARNYGS